MAVSMVTIPTGFIGNSVGAQMVALMWLFRKVAKENHVNRGCEKKRRLSVRSSECP